MTRAFDFVRFRYVMIAFSVLSIVGGFVATIAQGGFNFGIDFRAGLSLHVDMAETVEAPIEDIRRALQNIAGIQITQIGEPSLQEYSIRVKQEGEDREFSERTQNEVMESLGRVFGSPAVSILQADYIGPRFSADLASQTAFLTTFALGLILLYTWFRFKLGYAVSAIAATLHDTAFMIAVIGAFQFEVSTATVAAVLTIIGYSLNDTIVVFDRIRENEGLLREQPLRTIINVSLTQTMGRTIITSLTTLLAVVAIFIFARGEVQSFALNMIIGVFIGTFSSLFIASPILLAWRTRAVRQRAARERAKYGQGGIGGETPKAESPPRKDAPVLVDKEPSLALADAQPRRLAAAPARPRKSREQRKRRSGR